MSSVGLHQDMRSSTIGSEYRSPSEQIDTEEDGNNRPKKRLRRSLERYLNGARTSPFSTRRKIACQSCRLRKVKCDVIRPTCGFCKVGGMTCEYLDIPTDKLTLESATSNILDRLELMQTVILNGLTTNTSPEKPSKTQYLDHQRSITKDPHEVLESSQDFLQIPPHKTTADTVLNWEIFDNSYPKNALIAMFFTPAATHD